MADPTPAVETDELGLDAETQTSSSDAELAEIFRQAGEGVGESLEAKEPKPAETPTPDPTAEKLAKLEADLQKTREEQIELKTQNDIYRAGLLRNQQAQPAPAPTAPQAPKSLLDRLGYTKEALNEGLRTNAAGTITELIEKASEEAYQRAKTESVAEATRSAVGANAQNTAFQQDQAAASAEYGELLASNTEFSNLANKIYNELTVNGIQVNADGTRWSPRAMYLATSTAYAQMAKAGKFAPPTPDPKVVSLQERRKPPLSPITGDSTDTTAGRNPLTAGLSSEDLNLINKNATKLGIKPERYLKTLQAMRKKDPSFGGLG